MSPRASLFLALCVAASCVGQEVGRSPFDSDFDANALDKNVVHGQRVITVGCPLGFHMIDHQCVHSGKLLRPQPRRPGLLFTFLGGEPVEVPTVTSSAGGTSATTENKSTSETTTSTKSQAARTPTGAPPMVMTTTPSQRVTPDEDPVEETDADEGMIQGTTGGMAADGMAKGSADGMARGMAGGIGGGLVDGMTDGSGEGIGEETDAGTAGGAAERTISGLSQVLLAMSLVSYWISPLVG